VQRSCAAKAHQREVARVETALDRDQLDRVDHVGLGNLQNAECGLHRFEAKRRCDPTLDTSCASLGGSCVRRQGIIAVETAGQQVGAVMVGFSPPRP